MSSFSEGLLCCGLDSNPAQKEPEASRMFAGGSGTGTPRVTEYKITRLHDTSEVSEMKIQVLSACIYDGPGRTVE